MKRGEQLLPISQTGFFFFGGEGLYIKHLITLRKKQMLLIRTTWVSHTCMKTSHHSCFWQICHPTAESRSPFLNLRLYDQN